MISVPVGTGDIPCGYDICFADDIRFAYEGTDIISYFHEVEIYHAAKPYIISCERYIIEKHNIYDIIPMKEGAYMSENKLLDLSFEFAVTISQ